MLEHQKIRPASIVGPTGSIMTLRDLPKRNTRRWVSRRKAEVVAAVEGGLITIDEACDRYNLSIEEFASWQRAYDQLGMPALRATRVQYYREKLSH